jgi:hypothetical protein
VLNGDTRTYRICTRWWSYWQRDLWRPFCFPVFQLERTDHPQHFHTDSLTVSRHRTLLFNTHWFIGKTCFLCEPEDQDLDSTAGISTSRCAPCNKDLNLSNPIARILHNSAHILNDVKYPQRQRVCPLCLRKDEQCVFYIKWYRDAWHVDLDNSTCPMKINFKIATATTPSVSNPSTNSLIPCKFCLPKTRGIWKYNLHEHLKINHPTVSLAEYEADWRVERCEVNAMTGVWRRHKKFKKRKQPTSATDVRVSEAHISGMVYR